MRRGDRFNALRRHIEQRLDQAWALTARRLHPPAGCPSYDGEPRVAVVTVNRSTTRYLKLLLLTLAQQTELEIIRRIVIVDHDSRDGGDVFIDRLVAACPLFEPVHNRRFLNHARGMRAGLAALERVEWSNANGSAGQSGPLLRHGSRVP
ncbi:MAG TPA: hypothetical protein VK549_17795 [Acidimicrobiia bacterium]|nr:hypothetical protein [Acidimicrobiia bacterium]